jgi:hypothetical protein
MHIRHDSPNKFSQFTEYCPISRQTICRVSIIRGAGETVGILSIAALIELNGALHG